MSRLHEAHGFQIEDFVIDKFKTQTPIAEAKELVESVEAMQKAAELAGNAPAWEVRPAPGVSSPGVMLVEKSPGKQQYGMLISLRYEPERNEVSAHFIPRHTETEAFVSDETGMPLFGEVKITRVDSIRYFPSDDVVVFNTSTTRGSRNTETSVTIDMAEGRMAVDSRTIT